MKERMKERKKERKNEDQGEYRARKKMEIDEKLRIKIGQKVLMIPT